MERDGIKRCSTATTHTCTAGLVLCLAAACEPFVDEAIFIGPAPAMVFGRDWLIVAVAPMVGGPLEILAADGIELKLGDQPFLRLDGSRENPFCVEANPFGDEVGRADFATVHVSTASSAVTVECLRTTTETSIHPLSAEEFRFRYEFVLTSSSE